MSIVKRLFQGIEIKASLGCSRGPPPDDDQEAASGASDFASLEAGHHIAPEISGTRANVSAAPLRFIGHKLMSLGLQM
jgi:hypothetical protein